MQLANKKALAARIFGVGKDRVIFQNSAMNEIKEAITRQDIVDLQKSGAIQFRDIRGRRKTEQRKHRRGIGKVKKKVRQTKRKYIELTRKLRITNKFLLNTKRIDKEKYRNIRRMIKASRFKSKRHLMESLGELK